MVRFINAPILFSRALYCQKKWRIFSNAMSTSVILQNKEPNVSVITNKKTEFLKEYKKNYEDTFGNIENFERTFQRIKDDPEDILEYQRAKARKGKTTNQYIQEIKSLLNKHDYKSAIKVLEIDMLNDKIPTNEFVYRVLISYNSKLGMLDEAYRLFIDYKRRKGVVRGALYTSMFNACANCKNSFFAIEKANAVRECLNKNKYYSANISNYNAMLKAYGRHGDFSTCLKIMDEVIEKKDKVRSNTYEFLLQACVTDKNSGLRHALLVWRKMIQNRIKPTIYSFNLMLRCIRDCSLGDALLLPDLINQIEKESMVFFKKKVKIVTVGDEKKRTVLKIPADGKNLITPVENEFFQSQEKCKKDFIELNESDDINLEERVKSCEMLNSDSSQVVNHENMPQLSQNEGSSNTADNVSDSDSRVVERMECKNIAEMSFLSNTSDLPNLPNLLALKPTTGSVTKFGISTVPHYRLMYVGGMKGFLKTMAEFGVKPDLKTFTLMLSAIPPNLQAEKELMSIMEVYKIQLDTGFFNVLIKRRIFRDEEILVKDCLKQMHSLNLKPDILTFGILAISCRTYDAGMSLVKLLRDHGFRVNNEILHPLLKNAKNARDLNYVRTVLQAAKEDEVQLDSKIVALLSEIVKREKNLRNKNLEVEERASNSDKLKLEN